MPELQTKLMNTQTRNAARKHVPVPQIPARGEAGQPETIEIGLLTGGTDKPYAFGLAMALLSTNVCMDFIGSDEVDSPELRAASKLNFLNLRGNQNSNVSLTTRVSRVLAYYARLIRYAATARPQIFHILWNNKFEFFDRTLLLLYYKVLGKKIVLTAHNVNAATRDSKDTWLNRLTLRIQYRLADHIFVHTEKMRQELIENFRVSRQRATVIPFGINNSVPDTDLTPAEAKRRLGIRDGERTILFFGRIRPYKGLEYLVDAFHRITARRQDYRLIIAGQPKKGSEKYIEEIRQTIRSNGQDKIIQKMEYIPDDQTEVYFKAADVLVLPYTDVFQSGVLFLGYGFGLPVVAADVGSLKDDVIEGTTGFLCRPTDTDDLARSIETYFDSEIYKDLDRRRPQIRDYASQRHSWNVVGRMTRSVYTDLLEKRPAGDGSRALNGLTKGNAGPE